MEISRTTLFILIFVVFWWLARGLLRRGTFRPALVQALTTIMYVVLMAFVIVMSVFPHPNVPSVYFPLFLLVGPVIFLMPVRLQLLITLSGSVVFFPLVLMFKSPDCWSHELFESTTALLLSAGVMLLMMQLRVQTESLKNQYYLESTRDRLTGLLNKESGIAAASERLARQKAGEHSAVFFLDIDDFKSINDTCGHLDGDSCLRAVAGILQSVCRRGDPVCRFGGDEFMMLLQPLESAEAAGQRAEAILAAVRSARTAPRRMTCSIGVCFISEALHPLEEYIRMADSALYRAKNAGKNTFAVVSG